MLFQQGQSQQDKTTAWQLFVFIGHGQNKAKTLLCLWYTAKTKLNSIKGTLAPSIGLFICCNGLCFLPAAFSKQEQNEDKSALTQGWQSIDIYGFLSLAIKQEGGIPQGCFPLQSCCPHRGSPAQGHTKERLQPPLPSGLSLPSLIQPPALPSPAQEPLWHPSPEWSLFDPPRKGLIALFQENITTVIPVCHWDIWRSFYGIQRSLPLSLRTLCPLSWRPGLIFFSLNEWADYANTLIPLFLRMRLQVYQFITAPYNGNTFHHLLIQQKGADSLYCITAFRSRRNLGYNTLWRMLTCDNLFAKRKK